MGTSARSENGPEGSNGGAVSSIPTLSHSLTLTARGADGPGSALCSHGGKEKTLKENTLKIINYIKWYVWMGDV